MSLPVERRADQRTEPVFRILTVCSGNLCRSPLAAQLLGDRIPAALGMEPSELRAESAGTRAYDGEPMDALAAEEAERLGVADPRAPRSRRLREAHVRAADVILGMALEHRAAAVRLDPRAHRRAFTLVEFAEIVEALASGAVQVPEAARGGSGTVACLRDAVSAASTARALMPQRGSAGSLDIEDPYRRDRSVHRRSADAVDLHVRRVVAALAALAAAATPAS